MVDIALTGNPNVGKTSLYNRITHSMEHVGNWHGVTVTETSKKILFDHKELNITDLPGFYSMTVYSFEEGISRDSVLGGKHDLIINICEVNNLARNLYLTLQLLELDVPTVLVVNMMDELKKQGKVLNYRKIESMLKIPIVPMSAKYHSDVHLLLEVSLDYINTYGGNTVELPYLEQLPIRDVESIISANATEAGLKPRYAAVKLLERDEYILEKLQLNDEQKKAVEAMGDWQARVAQYRYAFIDRITEGAIVPNVIDEHHEMHEHAVHAVPIEGEGETEVACDKRDKHARHHDKHKEKEQLYLHGYSRLDRVLLNKYAALPIFLLLMAAIFIITFGLVGNWLSQLLELGIDKLLYEPITKGLHNIDTPRWIVDLLGEGIIHGVGGILTFLPQVVLLFFFLALLEDSGYISRVAFMTDGLFRKIGLSGRSAFTMLMGFGCSATAVLTARGLEDDMMRRKTVLLTPFMSCSARLPVYATIASAFFAPGKPFIIFGLYVLGAVVALGMAALFEKIKPLKSGKLSFIMEMPPYRLPTFERVWQLIWHNTKVFLVRVGTVIFALNVIVWILSNFSFRGYTPVVGGHSILESICGFIAPVFTPLGFGNWEAVTALVSGLIAKEVVVSSLLSFGGELSAVFATPLAALTFMVFTLLYIPCVATLSAVAKELGWKWMLFSAGLQLATAYLISLLFYGVGLLFTVNVGLGVGLVIVAVVAVICVCTFVSMFRNRGKCRCGCANCSRTCAKHERKKK